MATTTTNQQQQLPGYDEMVQKHRREQAERNPWWIPTEKGEVLVGVITDVSDEESKSGREYTKLTVTKHDNTIAYMRVTGWMKNELLSDETQIGDGIVISFEGQKAGRDGRLWDNYSMTVIPIKKGKR
jgi:hypothetical protein